MCACAVLRCAVLRDMHACVCEGAEVIGASCQAAQASQAASSVSLLACFVPASQASQLSGQCLPCPALLKGRFERPASVRALRQTDPRFRGLHERT